MYVTATFPYLVLIIFFFRGITLPGFERGLEHLFVPEVKNKIHRQMRWKVKLSIFAIYKKWFRLHNFPSVLIWLIISVVYRRIRKTISWVLSSTLTIISNVEFVLFSVEQVVWARGMAGRRHTDLLLLWPGLWLPNCTVVIQPYQKQLCQRSPDRHRLRFLYFHLHRLCGFLHIG